MQLNVPYCTSAELTEFPTFLDLINLRSSDPQLAHQESILNKILLMASGWVDGYTDIGSEATLTAHRRVENKLVRPDRQGRIVWHPDHIPFVSLESLAYGATIGGRTTYTAPPVFVEDERSVVIDVHGATVAWSGSLQLGGLRPGAQLYATMTYIAGYPNALLTASTTVGAVTLPVSDATGIQPGQVLRIYDPGFDETVTVGSLWVPTAGAGSPPLATPMTCTHTTTGPVRVTAMGTDILEATVLYTIALLMRPGSASQDSFPDMPGGISTRLRDSRHDGSGLVAEAQRLLNSYRRVI